MAKEDTFNVVLGGVLADISPDLGLCEKLDDAHGRDALFVEQMGILPGSKRPDLLIRTKDGRVSCLEAAYDEKGADKDAAARLGLKLADEPDVAIETAVAILPSDAVRTGHQREVERKLRGGGKLCYAVHQRLSADETRRWPKAGMVEGTVQDLLDFALATSVPKERVERTAEEVSARLASAAKQLIQRMGEENARRIASNVSRGSPVDDLQTTLLLWLNAILVQCRLFDSGFRKAEMPAWESIGRKEARAVLASWRRVLERNWRDVFEPAVDALDVALRRQPVHAANCLQKVANAVMELQEARLGPFVNVGAELFPRLIDDRKTSAAFYTQSGPAEFLAALALPRGVEFKRKAPVVADFACGTGTLLRAAYRRLRSLDGADTGSDAFHRRMMEKSLIGVDVSPIAAHLTQSGLAAIGGATAYKQTRIGWVEVGGKRHSTGSLEYLEKSSVDDLFGSAGGSSRATGESRSIAAGDGSVDCVLMNPPYSRTRGGQSAFDIAGMTAKERNGCQNRWRELTANVFGANGQAGLAASFLALAEQKVRRGGRIGFVLPLTAAFAESWSDARTLVEQEFEDVVALSVASGSALGAQALSADTHMEEMLLVGTRRKRKNTSSRADIVCVTLRESPIREGEASAMANAVREAVAALPDEPLAHRPVFAGEEQIGIAIRWSDRERGQPWSPLSALTPHLVTFAAAVSGGAALDEDGEKHDLPIGMRTIEDVFVVGPTHDRLGHLSDKDPRGGFEFVPRSGGQHLSLWASDAKTQTRLVVQPTHHGITPSRGDASSNALRKRMWKTRSTLFYQRGMRWTSQALLAAMTKRAAMGGRAWTSLTHKDPRVLQAATLWFNSTFGMLVQWHHGSRTQLGRSTSQVKQIASTPFPMLNDLDDDVLDEAAAEFKALSKEKLLPACQAHADPVRHRIDEMVVWMMDLPDSVSEELAVVRDLWCREPSVHGENKTALRLLEES